MEEPKFIVLVTDTLAESGLEILRADEEVELRYRPGLKGQELLDQLAEADAIITRSGTPVDDGLLAAGKRLRVVGRAGVGLDNVDVDAATARGVLVINTPTANIISATEHTLGLLLGLCRNLPAADASVRRGEWMRSQFMGTELNGKTLGIIGLGRIGSRVATRTRSFGMDVIAYDPYISEAAAERVGAELVPLDRLLEASDFITVHTPLNEETRGMIGSGEIARMKEGVIVVNCARGGIYDETALAAALHSGRIAGAAVDVYEAEPPSPDHPFLTAPNMVLTPHIGANTIEAQDRVAVQTAEMVVKALRGSIFVSAANLPFQGMADSEAAPYIDLAERIGSLTGQLLRGAVTAMTLELWGVEERFSSILSVAAAKGTLSRILNDSVNFVNAQSIAQQRGIDFSSTVHKSPLDYTNLLTWRVTTAQEEYCVSATLFSEKNQRVVAVNGFRVEFAPEGYLLYMVNRDVPGVVGKVGTILGDRDINIAEYNLARLGEKGVAMAIVTVDSPLDKETLNFLRSFKEMQEVKLVHLP